MTLSEMASYICSKVGQTDDESMAACKLFLDRRYRMIWDSALWRDTLSMVSFLNTTASSPWLLFPRGMERVLKLRVGPYNTVAPFDAVTVFDYDSETFENFGTPYGFTQFAPVVAGGVQQSYSLSSALDLDGFCSVEWEEEDGRTFTANNVAVPSTDNAWGLWLLRFNKPRTDYPVSLTGSETGSVQLYPSDTEAPRLIRVRLNLGPSDATACVALCKRACQGLIVNPVATSSDAAGGVTTTNDNNSPSLLNCENALLAFAQADMLERQRQYAKAAAKTTEGAAQVKLMLDLERNQSANGTRIIPLESGDGWENYDQWGSKTFYGT